MRYSLYTIIFETMYVCVVIILPAVVDLPTPPLPEATTTTFLTPLIGIFLGNPRCALGIVGAGLCRGNPC